MKGGRVRAHLGEDRQLTRARVQRGEQTGGCTHSMLILRNASVMLSELSRGGREGAMGVGEGSPALASPLARETLGPKGLKPHLLAGQPPPSTRAHARTSRVGRHR